jgi:hypothetical protein
MSDKNRKIPRLQLQEPHHAREYIRRLLREAKAKVPDIELSYMGRIAQPLGIWSKLQELEKVCDIEARLAAIEKSQQEEHR